MYEELLAQLASELKDERWEKALVTLQKVAWFVELKRDKCAIILLEDLGVNVADPMQLYDIRKAIQRVKRMHKTHVKHELKMHPEGVKNPLTTFREAVQKCLMES